MKRLLSKRLCALATLALVGTHLYAATVHPSEWTSLVTQAKLAAAVPVLVDVADVSLVELKYQGESNRAKSERYAANLLDELGAEAWRESSVVSPAGQVSAYVTARGLQLLRNSSNALAFRAGKEWFQTTRLHRSGEALALLRRRAVESGSVDVVVTLNVDGMGFWHSSSGAHGLEAPPETLKELSALTSKLQKRLLSIPGSKAGVMLADYATRQPSGANDATVTLRVTERELAALGTSESVRDIHAIDDTQDDFGPFYVSPKALADAEKSGQVEIIVALRSPIKRGHSSEKSDAIHLASVRAIMEDVKKT